MDLSLHTPQIREKGEIPPENPDSATSVQRFCRKGDEKGYTSTREGNAPSRKTIAFLKPPLVSRPDCTDGLGGPLASPCSLEAPLHPS
jgi:hypothetical protein